MKQFLKLFMGIFILSIISVNAHAGIFSTVKKDYKSVQATTQELHNKVVEFQCPNLTDIERSKCLAKYNGYSVPYGPAASDQRALFIYKSFSENVFGADRRQVEHIGYAFRIHDNQVVIFILERIATGYAETFNISKPVLRVYLDRLSDDSECLAKAGLIMMIGELELVLLVKSQAFIIMRP